MAQLRKDIFAFGRALATIDDITALIAERTPIVCEVEQVPLVDAIGRVLAENLIAPIDLPAFDNSAVDGYAVAFADLASSGETALPVVSRIAAGEEPSAAVLRRGATRIFTGAPMPPGADTVFMQEDEQVEGGRVILPAGLALGANARSRGEDIAKGALAIEAGQRLDPRFIALAAALGQARLAVRRPLRVAVFSTGDEIVAPGERLSPAKTYDSNRFALLALLGRQGCAVSDLGVLPDDQVEISRSLSAAAERHDLVVTSGGVSTGEADCVRAAIEASGSLVFWRLAIKPGRPIAMGLLNGAPIIGLPGNPVATFVAFAFVVRSLLAALGGERLQAPRSARVRSGFDYRKKAGRREFVRAKLVRCPDGQDEAHKHPVDGAGVLTSLTRTDGFVVLSEAVETVRVGDYLEFIGYGQLF
jgi:molybdopterin molybdotransferase